MHAGDVCWMKILLGKYCMNALARYASDLPAALCCSHSCLLDLFLDFDLEVQSVFFADTVSKIGTVPCNRNFRKQDSRPAPWRNEFLYVFPTPQFYRENFKELKHDKGLIQFSEN